MKKVVLVGLLIYALLIAGLIATNGSMLALIVPLLVYLAAGAIWGPAEARLRVARTMTTDHASDGSSIRVHLVVTNEGQAGEEVLIEDVVPEGLEVVEGSTQLLLPMPGGATAELNYSVRARRGAHTFPGVHVAVGEALDLFHAHTAEQSPQALHVVPRVQRLRRLALRPQRTLAHTGPFPARRGGPGVEFYGVREYQPGDPLRWVDWRASARHPESMYTIEFEQECTAEVGLILDVRERVYASADRPALFEHAIQAAASLADTLLGEGNRVGLLLFGSLIDWTIPGYGKVQRERILQTLSTAVLGGFLDQLEHLPTRLFPPRSQIVLVSPLSRGDQHMLTTMRAYGYPILVVSPNPVSLEPREDDRWSQLAIRIAQLERTLLLRKLLAAGIPVLDWSVEQPLDHAIHAHLGRRALLFRRRGVRP
jgi:uncharacterized protein (DUF58 family)